MRIKYILPISHGIICVSLLLYSFFISINDTESTVAVLSQNGKVAYITFIVVNLLSFPGALTVSLFGLYSASNPLMDSSYGNYFVYFMTFISIIITDIYLYVLFLQLEKLKAKKKDGC